MPTFSASLRTKTSAKERRVIVADMYLTGYSQPQIAEELGISQPTVSRDLTAIRKQWQREAVDSFDIVQKRELARIDKIESEAWEAWRRSIGISRSETTTVEGGTPDKKGVVSAKSTKKVVRTDNLVGDPRFLDQVKWCIEQRLKIYGVYQAAKLEIQHSWRDKISEDEQELVKDFFETAVSQMNEVSS